MTNLNYKSFQDSLADKDQFTLTFELVPSRGGRSKEINRIIGFANEAATSGRIQAVSITENAGGHSALAPEALGREILNLGLDVITHFSCKDKNRNQMESLLFAWDRIGLQNLLVIAGDYPQKGYRGHPKPVFDLDTIHVLDLLGCMNRGMPVSCEYNSGPGKIQCTTFFKGVALSPFKLREAELVMQYYKLHRKVVAGANFVITQVGFDARKFHEVLLYIKQYELDIPVLGNVFIPNLPVVEHMYQGRVPGCIIPENLYQEMQQEAKSSDRGRKARLIRAAKLLAVMKGMGYGGAHIGGPGLNYSDVEFVLDQADLLAPDWMALVPELSYWPPTGCYYFEKDTSTGLNSPVPIDRRSGRGTQSFAYLASDTVHNLIFTKTSPLFNPGQRLCLQLENSRASRVLATFEHLVKFLAFNCRNCGDCTLADLAYLCPQSGCAKYLLNGPCGGSIDGWCEVYPGRKRCLYVRIYDRLKPIGREEKMKSGFIPPRDWALNNTSSWCNFFEGRDHADKMPDQPQAPTCDSLLSPQKK